MHGCMRALASTGARTGRPGAKKMIEQPPARARHAAARSALILDETTRERESFVSRLSPHKLRLAAVLWRLPLVVFYMRAAAVYSYML